MFGEKTFASNTEMIPVKPEPPPTPRNCVEQFFRELGPGGKAYNIQRFRYREGYDRRPAWMEKGNVYKVTLQPMQTSTYFAPV